MMTFRVIDHKGFMEVILPNGSYLIADCLSEAFDIVIRIVKEYYIPSYSFTLESNRIG